jgi:transcriptional regulator with XRE-family HTH domain
MLGEILRKAREEAALTQEELAFQAGVDRTYVSQLENDKKSPTVQMLFRICAALKVPPRIVIADLERSMLRRDPIRTERARRRPKDVRRRPQSLSGD